MKRVIGLLVALTSLLAAAPTVHAEMILPTPRFSEPREDFARPSESTTCHYAWRNGVLWFGEMIHEASGEQYQFQGPRTCPSSGVGTSHHHSGRAIDLMIDHRDLVERADGQTFVRWLFAREANRLRRLGVVEIIWAGKIWTTARDSADNVTGKVKRWRVHQGCTREDDPTFCHYNHIHITFSVEGADGLTTFWTAQR